MAEMDMKILEGVVDGELCPLCYKKIKNVHGHITACGCMVLAQNEQKLMELMDWASEEIRPLIPTPEMSNIKRLRAERKLRSVQASVRQALNTITSPTQEARRIVHTDVWGNEHVEILTDRREYHGAITEYGGTVKVVKR